jgi:hypothetical protein
MEMGFFMMCCSISPAAFCAVWRQSIGFCRMLLLLLLLFVVLLLMVP